MKVKIIEPTFVGGENLKVGKTVEVSAADARNLITGGKAVPIADAPEEAAANRAESGDDSSTRG